MSETTETTVVHVRTAIKARLCFRKNNIPYGQGLKFYRGIPAGIDFEIAQIVPPHGPVVLQAPGYGCLDGRGYGNGKLYAHGWRVLSQARAALRRAQRKAE